MDDQFLILSFEFLIIILNKIAVDSRLGRL